MFAKYTKLIVRDPSTGSLVQMLPEVKTATEVDADSSLPVSSSAVASWGEAFVRKGSENETISGDVTFEGRTTYSDDVAMSGHKIVDPSGIELSPSSNTDNNGGYIDFRYNNAEESTSRIIESASGTVTINNVNISNGSVSATTFTGALNGNAATTTKLATARTINGASFDGTGNITTTSWGTARNISISDSDGTNTGDATSVNGSAAVTLKLPSTIKASLEGNASSANSVPWSGVDGKPSTFAPSSHNQASSTINAMTGYSKPTSTGAIATTDSLNAAIGKLEKALDGKQVSGSYAAASHNHDASNINSGTLNAARIPNLDASKITSGTIDIARLPAGALERLVTVADQTARFALTANDVQLGDTVRQEDTGLMYYVVDTSKLSSAAGYAVYTAGAATSVPWSGVTGKPSTFAPSSHNQASSTINAMTGYSKPSSTSAIGTSDTLNAAIGKLEKALDGKAASATTLAGYNISDAKIASGVITLGSSTITPLTSSSSLNAAKLTGTAAVNTTGNAATVTGTAGTSALAWNSEVTLYTVGGNAIKAKLPANPNTDVKVRQDVGTTNTERPILSRYNVSDASQTAGYAVYDTGVTNNPNKHTLTASGGFVGKLSGTPEGTTFVAAVTEGKALVNATTTGYGGIWNAPTKNYRVGCSTYPSSGDDVRIAYSVTNANVTAGTNTVAKSLTWNADSGTLTATAFSGPLTGNAATATKLATARAINGTNFDGSAAITTANWGTARNISISDSDGTNTGTAVSVNGSANATLKLPATIKASITGNVSGSSGSCTGNSATATKFASSQSVTLTGAITGTASSQAGWSVGTVWRSCMVGQSSSTTTNPWYKVASFAVTTANDDIIATFLVEDTYSSHKQGILKVHVRTDGSKVISSTASDLIWLSHTGFTLADFVLVCPTAASSTVEIWTKIATAYMHRRFTVLSEGSRSSTSIRWTLLNASSAGQAASITTTGTQIASTFAGQAASCTGNAATATKLATARSLWGNNFDGSAAISGTINGTPSIEFKPAATNSNNGGYLDFHYNQSTADYTSRIIESASGTLSINNVTITTGKVVTATTFTGALSGNASTATKLATARNINGVAFDGSANITIADSTKVAKTGDTMTGALTVKPAGPGLKLCNNIVTKGTNPSSNTWTYLELLDNANGRLGWIGNSYNTSGVTTVGMYVRKQDANTESSLGVGYNASKTAYTWAPTPAAADNSTQIATTAWVRGRLHISTSDPSGGTDGDIWFKYS